VRRCSWISSRHIGRVLIVRKVSGEEGPLRFRWGMSTNTPYSRCDSVENECWALWVRRAQYLA
jgi:hypothetical protein